MIQKTKNPSTTEQRCLIFFHRPAYTLDDVAGLLRARGLRATLVDKQLAVRLDTGSALYIALEHGDDVRRDAGALTANTEYAALARSLDRRFVITFDDFAAAVDEINTLIEVQATLQNATHGLLYNSWNGVFSEASE